MAKMTARTEANCMLRVFSILDTQNGCSSPEMIDYSRMDHRTSFDEECRKIQYEADLAGNAIERNSRDLIREDKHILKQNNKDTLFKRLQGKRSLKAYQQSSTSAEMPLDGPAFAATIGTASIYSHHDDVELSEGFGKNVVFVDHITADRKFESNPFSEALKVLNSDKDLIMEILSEPNCLLQKCSRKLQNCQTVRETFSSVSEANHQFLSSKTCPTSQKCNKTATLKSELQKGKSSENFSCHCSFGQSRNGSSSTPLAGSHASFSMRDIKRKLKHTFGRRRRNESNSNQVAKRKRKHTFGHDCVYRGVEAKSPLSYTTNAKVKEKLGRKQGLKVEMDPHVAWQTHSACRKIDVSSHRSCMKHGVNADSDATGDLSARLQDLKVTGQVISSHEIDSCLRPRRESQYCSGSVRVINFSPYRQRKCLHPLRSNNEAKYDGTNEAVSLETSSSLVPSSDEEEQDGMIFPPRNMRFYETKILLHSEANYDTMIRNAQKASIADEYGSPTSVNQFDMCDTKNQEHPSPVSVLDQSFADEYISPSTTAYQSASAACDPIKPRGLHFEECTLAPSSQVPPTTASPCMHPQNQTISNYVRVIIQASSLDWDQLSAIKPPSRHLLHPSLFDDLAEFLLSDPHFDTRLLFDHVNEVLIKSKRYHFASPYWPSLVKPRICFLPLEEVVIDEIMREAQFHLLPQTEKRTLNQLVAQDLSGSRLQLNLQPENEQIILRISEDILEESVLDVILQLHS